MFKETLKIDFRRDRKRDRGNLLQEQGLVVIYRRMLSSWAILLFLFNIFSHLHQYSISKPIYRMNIKVRYLRGRGKLLFCARCIERVSSPRLLVDLAPYISEHTTASTLVPGLQHFSPPRAFHSALSYNTSSFSTHLVPKLLQFLSTNHHGHATFQANLEG